MQNTPEVKLGVVAVSRDCFPIELSRKRLNNLVAASEKSGLKLIKAETIIENEKDALKASCELYEKGANAVVVYLGNFGPEGPTSIFIERFHGPVMACAAAEESGKDLINGRGDAFCGMLNLSYNLKLKNLRVHIPEAPVGLPEDLTKEISHFEKIAKIWLGVKKLKVFGFGPRPQDFFACNAPIKPLYDLGVEVMENSELDLLELYKAAAGNSDIKDIAAEMTAELGAGNTYPDMITKLAQFESALKQFMSDNLGSREYAVFADKCWPAFEKAFGFVPCYVNSRLASKGIPVACEVDMYGAVSEYMAQLASGQPATILDINNTVPPDMTASASALEGYDKSDLFMGFHCGNTPKCCLREGCSMKYQLIMNRLMEGGNTPDITRGTLEGYLKPGEATVFRLQSTSDCELRSYVADGSVLKMNPNSFGAIGVIAVKGLRRFYRHVLVGGNYPHHSAVAFKHSGKVLFDAVKLLSGITPSYPLPENVLYPQENPFN
jgi:L-fucose isomerase-like protein